MEVHIFTSRDKTQHVDMENSFCKMPYKFNKTCIKCNAIFLVMAIKLRMIYCYCTSKVKKLFLNKHVNTIAKVLICSFT